MTGQWAAIPFEVPAHHRPSPTLQVNEMKKWTPHIGWCLALGLTILCLILIFHVRERVLLEKALRANPALLDQHRDRSEMTLERPLLLITGDSRAKDLGTTKIGRFHVENRGIAGQTTTEVLARVGRDMAILRPDQVIVIAGINDLKISSADGEEPTQAAAALMEILAIGEAMNIPVTLLEAWGASESITLRGMFLPSHLASAVRALNLKITKMKRPESARIASTNAILNDNDLVRAELARDALHLNDRGLDILRKLILESLDGEKTDTN